MCFLALGRLPVIRARLERAAERPISPIVLERLAVIVFLHDADKHHPGFQAKGWPSGIWKMPTVGHVREGAELYCPPGEIARNLLLEDLIRWGIAEGALLVSALSHHGRPISLAGLNGAQWAKVRMLGWPSHYAPTLPT